MHRRTKGCSVARPGNSAISESLKAALKHHNAGRLGAAEAVYRQILGVEAKHPDALHLLGIIAWQRGSVELAINLFTRAISANPGNPLCHNNLGSALQLRDKLDEAVASFRQAILLKPDFPDSHFNLGTAFQRQGRVDEAEASYRQAVLLKPDYPEAYNNLGNVLGRGDKCDEAVTCFHKAISLKPDYSEAYNNLGLALQQQGKLDEAATSYCKAISLKPDNCPEVCFNLANVLKEQGKLDQAVICYLKAISVKPDNPEAYYNLGIVLAIQGKLDEAIASFHNTILLKPDHAKAYYNLGKMLEQQDKANEAVLCYQKAIEFEPDNPDAYYNLGIVLATQGKLEDAFASYHKAIVLKPDYSEAHSNLGGVLATQGKLDEAVICYKTAIKFKPDNAVAYSNLLFLHASTRDISPEAERALASHWEDSALSAGARAAARNRQFAQSSRAGRKLRVGIVSAELGVHAVAEFLEPILEQLDHDRFRVTLFPTTRREGARTDRILALADDCKSLVGLSDAHAAELIRSTEIDILMDTSGHTENNRLGVFAHRAAPVQLSYIGYWSTTGLTEMDWYFIDLYAPPSLYKEHFTEELWQLPRLAVCYRGDETLPCSAWKPSPDGTVWLGSFNRYPKIQEATIKLWANVMKAIPESKLLLEDRGIDDSDTHRRIVIALGRCGISGERIEFEPRIADHVRHMVLYDRLDIALDTLPFNSGTTACDALWMGVPLVALEGNWSGGRIASSFLRGLGKPEWVAQDEDQYVEIVAGLARDVKGRIALRPDQRSRMASSPLCNSKTLTEALEDAFERMFDIYLDRTHRNPAAAGA